VNLFVLQAQVAVVTGSSRGIGRAIAERLAQHGARVVISSRNLEPCEQVAAAINAQHGAGRAIAVAANISRKEALQNLIAETTQRLGPVDVLVCNAASNPYYGPMAGIADEQFRKILDNNIIANHWLINFVAPGMIERKGGPIIIVPSIGGPPPLAGPRHRLHQQAPAPRTGPDPARGAGGVGAGGCGGAVRDPDGRPSAGRRGGGAWPLLGLWPEKLNFPPQIAPLLVVYKSQKANSLPL